jgi:hypothetical protein
MSLDQPLVDQELSEQRLPLLVACQQRYLDLAGVFQKLEDGADRLLVARRIQPELPAQMQRLRVELRKPRQMVPFGRDHFDIA